MQRLQHYVIRVFLGVAALAALVGVWGTAQAGALLQTTTLSPGMSLTVSCSTVLSVKMATDKKSLTVSCAAANSPTPPPSATKTRTPTKVVPTKTATAIAPTITQTRTPTRTSTVVPPTPTAAQSTSTPMAMPTQGSTGLDTVKSEILGTCSAAVHDRFVTTGPDGNIYRTWHPQTVPVDANNPNGVKCIFAHEHGDDPTTSLANPSMPPFGYINAISGMAEAHEGFKVFVVNRGTVNDEGRTAQTSTRIVAHMGTGGAKRFVENHHTLLFDLVAPDGHAVHVLGMADTGLAGSICDRDASLQDNDPTNDVGRAVVTLPGTGCDIQSLYEIWLFKLDIAGKATILASTAVFDPITVLNPADRTQAMLTSLAFPKWGDQNGCNREGYHGPVYWYNRSGPKVIFTDAFGNPGGPIRQEISNHADIGIPMSNDQTQFKYHRPTCAPGLGVFN